MFNGPDIDKMLKNAEFKSMLKAEEKVAFEAIDMVIKNFLGNKRAENYKEIVEEMIDAFRVMRVNMSLKIHFLADHLDFFPENCGDCSDEHGERFHKDIAKIEASYKGKSELNMLGDYCWRLCRDTNPIEHKRQTKRAVFLTL